jgi:hypothetical protein
VGAELAPKAEISKCVLVVHSYPQWIEGGKSSSSHQINKAAYELILFFKIFMKIFENF